MEDDQILDVDFNSDSDKINIELISLNKFILLYILSFGLYGLWWMYKSWKFFKEKDNLDVMPAARAIFAILFTYPLFERIHKYAKSNGYTNSFSSSGLFIVFLLLNLLSRLPDPYWLISLAAFVGLTQPFQALNFAINNSENYKGVEQNGFNSRQIVIIVLGGIFWLLVLTGMMMLAGES